MSSSSECNTISREGRTIRSSIRSQPVEVQLSNSSSKRNSYRLGSTSLDRRKLRASSFIGLPTVVSESVSGRALIRFLHAASVHLHDVRPQEVRAWHPAGAPQGHHAGLLSDGQDRRARPERRRK